ncbi:flagellar motor protein MotB [Candidatus Velamenicoccus archaeovorus]|uniref:Flagellar motor protein MotB n=1 Tax=Velamenicoccus archaeovorus TaxID=1930593 RepID=A0A410P678_VELA1|nr:flagellar motor protein MotB [Candidatus Velamenicoccus archaeovorus]QAT17663.1 flagellar motor protein MotB [Candidatus Velamenicoccus archaeovorus]
MAKIIFRSVIISVLALTLTGCTTLSKKRALERENERLREQVATLEEQKDADLQRALKDLTANLKDELANYKAKLEMTERGLVITFLAEVFFDSGKDTLRPQGKVSLEKVAQVINKDVPDSRVAIEGHTDSDPIKYSGWKSNWELSSARALAVLHYFVDEGAVKPERLSAVAYGEYQPVASNDTKEGKQENRRVEIVILPSHVEKVKAEE